MTPHVIGMENPRILDGLLLASVLLIPLLVVWAVFYFGAARAFKDRGQRLIRQSANVIGGILGVIYVLICVSLVTCTGNMLYGYRECSLIPKHIADLSLPSFLLGTPLALIAMIAVVVVAALMQRRAQSSQ
ncbi:hypothetical protein [Nereida sp. MMG025]|uniref:hypothetical protein n=1 Tax=Nereida sp. MMG025 TaxID=2909981 RepID=UPI001F215D19|nr:hypothetical protein [Nereida sp. MMG025]MCF6445206.1 hypothetical protein [Nereida sp. MMG025]